MKTSKPGLTAAKKIKIAEILLIICNFFMLPSIIRFVWFYLTPWWTLERELLFNRTIGTIWGLPALVVIGLAAYYVEGWLGVVLIALPLTVFSLTVIIKYSQKISTAKKIFLFANLAVYILGHYAVIADWASMLSV